LSNFINQYFNTERGTKINNEVNEEKQDISLIHDNQSLKTECLKGKKLCILGFLDGRSNKDSVKQFENSMKILENIEGESRKKSRHTSFGWVNATCHVKYVFNFIV